MESNQLKAKLMADGDDAGGGRQRQQETGEEGKDVGFTAPLASKQVGGDEVPDPDLDETESGESDSGVCAESGHATSLAGSSLARTGEQPPEGNGESAHTPKQANPSLAGRSNSGDVHAMSLSGQYRASKAKKPAGER